MAVEKRTLEFLGVLAVICNTPKFFDTHTIVRIHLLVDSWKSYTFGVKESVYLVDFYWVTVASESSC